MKLLFFVLIFFIIGALVIVDNNNLYLFKPQNQVLLGEKFVSWLDLLYQNVQTLGADIGGLTWFYTG